MKDKVSWSSIIIASHQSVTILNALILLVCSCFYCCSLLSLVTTRVKIIFFLWQMSLIHINVLTNGMNIKNWSSKKPSTTYFSVPLSWANQWEAFYKAVCSASFFSAYLFSHKWPKAGHRPSDLSLILPSNREFTSGLPVNPCSLKEVNSVFSYVERPFMILLLA